MGNSCSRLSKLPVCTLPSKPSFPFMPTVELPVASLILEMVLPILSQSMKVSPFLTPFTRTSSPVEPLLTTSSPSSLPMVSKSKVVNPHGTKLLEPLRKRPLSSPSTLRLIKLKPLPAPSSPRTWGSQMVKPSVSTPQDSWPQKLSSTQASSRKVTKLWACTNLLLNPSLIAILMLELTFTETSSFPEEPPFTRVSQIDSRKKFLLSAQKLEMLRSLPLPIDTTPYGLVVPSNAPSKPSPPNGSPKTSTRRTVPRSFTESAYETLRRHYSIFAHIIKLRN